MTLTQQIAESVSRGKSTSMEFKRFQAHSFRGVYRKLQEVQSKGEYTLEDFLAFQLPHAHNELEYFYFYACGEESKDHPHHVTPELRIKFTDFRAQLLYMVVTNQLVTYLDLLTYLLGRGSAGHYHAQVIQYKRMLTVSQGLKKIPRRTLMSGYLANSLRHYYDTKQSMPLNPTTVWLAPSNIPSISAVLARIFEMDDTKLSDHLHMGRFHKFVSEVGLLGGLISEPEERTALVATSVVSYSAGLHYLNEKSPWVSAHVRSGSRAGDNPHSFLTFDYGSIWLSGDPKLNVTTPLLTYERNSSQWREEREARERLHEQHRAGKIDRKTLDKKLKQVKSETLPFFHNFKGQSFERLKDFMSYGFPKFDVPVFIDASDYVFDDPSRRIRIGANDSPHLIETPASVFLVRNKDIFFDSSAVEEACKYLNHSEAERLRTLAKNLQPLSGPAGTNELRNTYSAYSLEAYGSNLPDLVEAYDEGLGSYCRLGAQAGRDALEVDMKSICSILDSIRQHQLRYLDTQINYSKKNREDARKRDRDRYKKKGAPQDLEPYVQPLPIAAGAEDVCAAGTSIHVESMETDQVISSKFGFEDAPKEVKTGSSRLANYKKPTTNKASRFSFYDSDETYQDTPPTKESFFEGTLPEEKQRDEFLELPVTRYEGDKPVYRFEFTANDDWEGSFPEAVGLNFEIQTQGVIPTFDPDVYKKIVHQYPKDLDQETLPLDLKLTTSPDELRWTTRLNEGRLEHLPGPWTDRDAPSDQGSIKCISHPNHVRAPFLLGESYTKHPPAPEGSGVTYWPNRFDPIGFWKYKLSPKLERFELGRPLYFRTTPSDVKDSWVFEETRRELYKYLPTIYELSDAEVEDLLIILLGFGEVYDPVYSKKQKRPWEAEGDPVFTFKNTLRAFILLHNVNQCYTQPLVVSEASLNTMARDLETEFNAGFGRLNERFPHIHRLALMTFLLEQSPEYGRILASARSFYPLNKPHLDQVREWVKDGMPPESRPTWDKIIKTFPQVCQETLRPDKPLPLKLFCNELHSLSRLCRAITKLMVVDNRVRDHFLHVYNYRTPLQTKTVNLFSKALLKDLRNLNPEYGTHHILSTEFLHLNSAMFTKIDDHPVYGVLRDSIPGPTADHVTECLGLIPLTKSRVRNDEKYHLDFLDVAQRRRGWEGVKLLHVIHLHTMCFRELCLKIPTAHQQLRRMPKEESPWLDTSPGTLKKLEDASYN